MNDNFVIAVRYIRSTTYSNNLWRDLMPCSAMIELAKSASDIRIYDFELPSIKKNLEKQANENQQA